MVETSVDYETDVYEAKKFRKRRSDMEDAVGTVARGVEFEPTLE